MTPDTRHPFYRPLWRRVLIVAVCLVWGAVEFWYEAPFWGTIALGLGAYAAWTFLYAYDPDGPP